MMIQVPAPANSFTDARFATWLIKHFQIPIRGIQLGPSQSRRRRRPTPSACSCRIRRIWRALPRRQRHSPRHRGRGRDARWCPGQPRWCDAQAQRFGLEGDHCASGRCGHCSKAAADRGTIHSWSAWPSYTRNSSRGNLPAYRSPVTRPTR